MLDDFRAVYLPYCLQKQTDGRYAVLNREYKPVGFYTHEWIKYSDYPVCLKINGMTATLASKLSYDGNSNTDQIHLYDDATSPSKGKSQMKAYLEKLALLATLKIDEGIS
jgi:hypothetical protein